MILQHCNGGSLQQLRDRYMENGKPVPEHFIWHVARQLSQAIAYLHFGRAPEHSENMRNTEAPIYNCNIKMTNTFLHYLPRDETNPMTQVLGERVFPLLVLSNFGSAATPGHRREYDEGIDTYAIGYILRYLSTSRIAALRVNDV
ncbi:hypothetical protein F4779DRAFT_638509 [Xylariaceae sp. FL0662B]|nr:hypothetical protein F4779DRAFT_638509 [Xylariaceae sp. FL0662B]